jgi:ribosomal protein S18 acetylase RimI-like enzyme
MHWEMRMPAKPQTELLHAFKVKRIRRLPANLDLFLGEIADGLGRLYGPGAARQYLDHAPATIGSAMRHPAVQTWAAVCGDEAAALAMCVARGAAGRITLLHVLGPYRSQALEAELVAEAVRGLRGAGAESIVCEAVPMGPMDLTDSFGPLGFTAMPRVLMLAPLSHPQLAAGHNGGTEVLTYRERAAAAAIVVEAYQDHPDRPLHPEVRDVEAAAELVAGAAAGSYGETRPEFHRTLRQDGELAGVILGCQVAPGVGFVLQVAVRPACQRQGMGACLMQELAAQFRRAGFTRAALGVTAGNPARRLYERLGFSVLQSVDAFYWPRT